MKPSVKTALVASTTLVIGAVGGFCLPTFYYPANWPANVLISFHADTSMSELATAVRSRTAALQHIRAGDNDKAIRILEAGLDQDIIGLRTDKGFSAGTNNLVQKALASARDYRKAYPRTAADPLVDQMVKQALDESTVPGGNAK